MRLASRCQQLLRGACRAAEQGCAFCPSGVRQLELGIQRLGDVTNGGFDIAAGVRQLWGSTTHGIITFAPSTSPSVFFRKQCFPGSGLPWALSQACGLFGACKPAAPNPQIHTHDKYKRINPQPKYDWMKGRFVLDRNGTIWHRQANYVHHRYCKTASQLTRLKRWKPLHHAYAAKMIKVGFRARFWAPPDPQEVPGAHVLPDGSPAVYQRPTRWSARPNKDPTTGDPALRQSWKPPPRQKLR